MTQLQEAVREAEVSAVNDNVEQSYEDKLKSFWAGTELRNEGWTDDAACSGLPDRDEVFSPEIVGRGRYWKGYVDARLICGRCAVRNECLNDTLLLKDYESIRGGLNKGELQKVAAKISRDPYEARVWAEERRLKDYEYAVKYRTKQLKEAEKNRKAS